MLAALGCAGGEPPPPVAPAPAPAPAPAVESNTFVSTDHNAAPGGTGEAEETEAIPSGLAVREPHAARALAEAAVADRLNPQQTWKTSPALPATWPPKDKQVMFLFFPMAANPASMTHFQLFSAAFRVDVSLLDGATEVKPLEGRRKLGTVVEVRPSVLERNELDIAERSLFKAVSGDAETEMGENGFWGYLKYFHEHPKLAGDIKRHSPAFSAWLSRKR